MSFEKIDIRELELSPVRAIGDNWAILTGCSDEGFNSMTVSWGGMGVMWNKPVVFVFVRPGRHTFKFMENGEGFSLALMGEGMHEKMAVFGKKSGRDCDKYKESGFTPVTEDGITYPAEAETVLVCKTLSAGNVAPEWFRDAEIDGKNYPAKDYHRMYIGEIVTAMTRKA